MSPTAVSLPDKSLRLSQTARSKALVLGYFGARNLGDEMMLYCLSRWFQRQGIAVAVLADDPFEVPETHNLRATRNVPLLAEWGLPAGVSAWLGGSAWKVLRAVRESDVVVAGGGDSIRDDRGYRQFLYATEKLLLALLLKKKIALLNVGVAQVKTRIGRRILGYILRHSSMTVVRDDSSLALCRSLGATNLYRANDIAYCLPRLFGVASHLHDSSIQFDRSSELLQPYLLVCLRSGSNVYRQYELSEFRLQNLAKALDSVSASYGLRIVFMPFQGLEQADDNEVHRSICDRMGHSERAEILPWSSNLREAVAWIARARCVIAMRLHAAVLAAASQRPCIVMPYDKKVSEFQQSSGIEYSITPGMLDSSETVLTMIVNCLEQAIHRDQVLPEDWDNLDFPVCLQGNKP